MIQDLVRVRRSLAPHFSGPADPEAVRRLGPYTRKVLGRLLRPDVPLGRAVADVMKLPPGARGRHAREVRAVGGVLAEVAFDILHAALHADQPGRAYEAYFREDYPLGVDTPATLGEAVVRALGEGEEAVAALVVQRAAGRLGQPVPGRGLSRCTKRFLPRFEVLAGEALRLYTGPGPAELRLPPAPGTNPRPARDAADGPGRAVPA